MALALVLTLETTFVTFCTACTLLLATSGMFASQTLMSDDHSVRPSDCRNVAMLHSYPVAWHTFFTPLATFAIAVPTTGKKEIADIAALPQSPFFM